MMGGDQVVVHIPWVGGGVAQARQVWDFGERAQQAAQAPTFVVPGVDVLAEQGDLAGALPNEMEGLSQDCGSRAALLGAAGVGDNAEAAELVAAFLDGQEGGDALWRGAVRKMVELVLGREVGLDDLPPARLAWATISGSR